MWKKTYAGLGVVIVLGTIYAGFLWVDANIAKAEDVKKAHMKIDAYIIKQEIRDLQKRLWEIEDRYGKDPGYMPAEWRKEYRCIQQDMKKEEAKLKEVGK